RLFCDLVLAYQTKSSAQEGSSSFVASASAIDLDFELFMSQRKRSRTSSVTPNLTIIWLKRSFLGHLISIFFYDGNSKVPNNLPCNELQEISWSYQSPQLHLSLLSALVGGC
ncbi:hypothetical protein LINPERHAP2_LOCUS35876, partial [Linum perenne]